MARRYALLSDIHSNLGALTAVLDDLDKRHVDTIINLGDILYGPLEPLATYELLRSRDIVTIRGNQDRQIYEARATEIAQSPTLAFILENLGDEPVEWLRSLPPTATVDGRIFACHGTPTDDTVYLLEDVSSGSPILNDDDSITRAIGNIAEPIVVCGHSHLAHVVHLGPDKLVVNPGSVGLPAYQDEDPFPHKMQSYSPHASYAIIDFIDGHQIHVEIHRTTYDEQSASRLAAKHGRPDWSRALASGRV
ncbi:MAG: metallophosphoesterase family protein [Acidimicrobiia bacterium]|nr:MAG: metallophosphoesterase family protein [Acidimicrobiia bacterium]